MARVQKKEALLALAAIAFSRREIGLDKLCDVAMRYATAKWHNRKRHDKTDQRFDVERGNSRAALVAKGESHGR